MTSRIDTTTGSKSRHFKAWFELVRVPNLFTVPGDTLAGYSLACFIFKNALTQHYDLDLIWLVGASLAIYAAGLILNDIADIKIDHQERPGRPLPSGRISAGVATLTAIVLLLTSLLLVSFISIKSTFIAFFLICLVCCYNFYTKHHPLAGPISMGLCRGLNVLLGASIVRLKVFLDPMLVILFLQISCYIMFVSMISQKETEPYQRGNLRWYPFLSLLAGYPTFYIYYACFHSNLTHPHWSTLLPPALSLLSALAALTLVYRCKARLVNNCPPPVIQKTIGSFISALLFIQVSFIFIFGPNALFPGLVILSFWIIVPLLRKHFYCS